MDHQGTTYPSIARQTLPKCNNCITKYSHPVCFSSNERINENMLYQKSGSLFQNLDLRPTILLTPGLHLWNPGGLQDSDPGSRYILSRPLRVVFFYFESSSSRVVVKSPSTESSSEQQQQWFNIVQSLPQNCALYLDLIERESVERKKQQRIQSKSTFFSRFKRKRKCPPHS